MPKVRGRSSSSNYGTRTTEGSIAYSSLLRVIETCGLRQVNSWEYISSVIKLARKGLNPPLLPTLSRSLGVA